MQVACDVVHRHNYIIVAYIFETKAVSQAADARQGLEANLPNIDISKQASTGPGSSYTH